MWSHIVNESDQEIPQSLTADNPVETRGRAAQPAIVKRGRIGSKGGWVLSTIVCCKVFRDWSIINIQERSQFY